MQTPHLTLLSQSAPTPQDQCLLRLSEWMGVSTIPISLENARNPSIWIETQTGDPRLRLAMSADVLALLFTSSNAAEWLSFFEQKCEDLLVFGITDVPGHGEALKSLTRGAVAGVNGGLTGGADFEIPVSSRKFTKQLAGIRFPISPRASPAIFSFRCPQNPSLQPIMHANGAPTFAIAELGQCHVFLVTGPKLPDVTEAVSLNKKIHEFYDQLIPPLVFVRHTFPDHSWHSLQSTARLIVDDPLLGQHYGMLDYGTLLNSMKRAHYATTIAFIPWNYRRTNTAIVSSLLQEDTNLSICIHGCDHNAAEFTSLDQQLLERKAALSLDRMRQQQARTGAPFDEVMIFPQGGFSIPAISALRASNYLAAANSRILPTTAEWMNGCGGITVTLGDWLRPALTKFFGFPIFQRYYPRRDINLAFSLFVGRPALIVEHHEYFRDDCKEAEELASKLQSLEPGLTWPSLAAQLMRSCLLKCADTDLYDVQFYTHTFQFRNPFRRPTRFWLEKHEPDPSRIQSVQVGGVDTQFSWAEGFLRLELLLRPGEDKQIQVNDRPRPVLPSISLGAIYNLQVAFRRGMSEFRDNTLRRYPPIAKLAVKFVHLLRRWPIVRTLLSL